MRDAAPRIYEFGEFRLDVGKRLLLQADGEPVPLMPKAFETLHYLVSNSGRVIEKDELMREIWADTIVEENNLNQNISTLRRVLGEKRGEHRFIATIPGQGYKFVADVRETNNEPVVDNRNINVRKIDDLAIGRRYKNYRRAGNRIPLFVGLVAVIVAALAFFFWNRPVNKSPVRSVAVLPFKPLVAENREEALEIGMADTLIARLAGSTEVVVRPLSSVRRFGNQDADPQSAGRELGVEAVLDGSVQRWGDKIRVNVRLINVTDGASLWSGTFDEKFTDIFVVQDAISSKVAEAMSLHLAPSEQKSKRIRGTDSVEAYGFYLKGRYHALKLTEPDIRKGIAFYQQAIELDPTYAMAYAGIADAYNRLPITSDTPPHDSFPKAKAAAEQALQIDSGSADALIVLGWVSAWYEHDWSTSERFFKQSIEIQPNNAESHLGYAHLLLNLGRFEGSIAEIRRARELDPVSLIINSIEGMTLFYAGQHDEAIDRLNRTFEIEPNFWVARVNLAKIYIHQRRFAEAIVELERAREFSKGNSETISLLGYALAQSGRVNEAERELAELQELAKMKYVPPYNIAMLLNGLGRADEAFGFLQTALSDGDVRLIFLKIDPKWNSFRADPRFVELMKRLNF